MKTLQSVVILAVVIGLVMTSPAPAAEKTEDEAAKRYYDLTSCYVNGHVYRDGEVFSLFSSRCIKYRCNRGGYDFYEEACEVDGKCHPVGSIMQRQCRSYRCDVSNVGNSHRYYSLKPVGGQLCEDYYGQCRLPGDKFVYNMRGRVKRNCTCQTSGNTIQYICYD